MVFSFGGKETPDRVQGFPYPGPGARLNRVREFLDLAGSFRTRVREFRIRPGTSATLPIFILHFRIFSGRGSWDLRAGIARALAFSYGTFLSSWSFLLGGKEKPDRVQGFPYPALGAP